ncbi:unnamed protein product [Rotaria magnacalcarata]|uniref:Uncharacterized protein n=1 Tax=Rotaria magnacalcarata TaxID=392030 RepID=A0A819WTK8_9BILA|nr:unnamed protein product [Rotaria magnacalcarata]CAF2096487.1 unnamed protein product [Rotaria magnacalcarata]CAF2108870.1 unnamed protein product [Rotaria magnacalcarata]CAF4004174.1 unnamed protein product [Rotaria magnacalcarata]CAF4081847.1 unnamed protein product [Rotaria magnacalcarata]
MSEDFSGSTIPEDYDYKTPDHLIIWLDAHIGDPEKYHNLKKSFSSNIDPRNQTWTMLTGTDIDDLLRVGEPKPVKFGGILVLLITFTDPNACYQAFETYSNKRILFITSGTLGKHIVPRILENFPQVFTDPVAKVPYNAIYVFCGYISAHIPWAMPFLDYILMFNHETDLLLRMTCDMAKYYLTKADRLYADGDLVSTRRTYGWSKKLFLQNQKMGGHCEVFINEVNRKADIVENNIRSNRLNNTQDSNSSDDERSGCEPCS